MSNTNEPRALTAALSQPAFVTRGGGLAMHVANRHVSRWAPEVGEPGANRIRPLRNLGFVDRLVSPWIESAQRSASLRMFSQYISTGAGERPTSNVSWVFPRPWYQDELDWMAAARAVGTQAAVEPTAAPQMFTTRGTYVAPAQIQRQLALPSALHEYVAPSLSIARPDLGGNMPVSEAYSPLVPLAATGAAQVMARAMAPLLSQSAQATTSPTAAAARMSPGLRSVLATMLERSSQHVATEPSRISSYAPELVTPPAPRPEISTTGSILAPTTSSSESYEQATQVAEQYAEQRAHIVELQRVARAAAEKEYVARETARAEQQARTTEQQQQRKTEQQQQSPGQLAEIRAAEARAIEQRQAEIQQRSGELAAQRTVADTARREADRVAQESERARLEERIAQRIAERTQSQQEAQRLHSASRDAAARDARVSPMPEPRPVAAPTTAQTESRVAMEIAAAVASLPPELASMVAGSIGNRPDRAVQAIAELGEALRTVELIARNTASGGSIEPTRGPRLVMPAGLGGLVSTVERTTQTTPAAAARMPSLPMMQAQAPLPPRPIAAPIRMPAMSFLAAPNAPTATSTPAPTSALGAATAMQPAALSHVAWSDRWLARFAGAKASSLDVLSAANASPEMRLEMLAAAAPGTVFVAPFFDEQRGTTMVSGAGREDVLPTLRNAQPEQQAVRIADDAETSDEVFAAISRARSNAPVQSRAAAAAAAAPVAPTTTFDRETLADLITHAAPSAPGAGLAAGLASSPFAPALRHVMPVAAAPTFDVRALFGGGLGATYLAGLLAASTDEIATPAAMPSWASWTDSASAMTALPAFGDAQPMREIAGFDPTYVAPELPRPTIGADGMTGADETMREQIAAATASATAAATATATAEHVTTLRSALLSFDVETIAAQVGMPAETRVSAPSVSMGTTLARSMIETMTMPMLADTAALDDFNAIEIAGLSTQSSSYAAPGMIADRALGWSVAQERSTSDLSFDFVSPELVLAARVYGLGPAEAAQAARLAIGGPGQLSAMAGAVDRTFVQALAIESERRAERSAAMLATTSPGAIDGEGRTRQAREVRSAFPSATGEPTAVADDAAPLPSLSLFGVQRRSPRGAFLWPAATTAALGLNAAAPDGELSMSVAALELLAAQSVAELGTYAALSERGISFGADGAMMMSTSSGTVAAGGSPSMSEGTESDVLASAAAMVPMARREKFNALYAALGSSSSTKSWSPAARAARALALAGRGDESITSRERATAAWDVLPMVYGAGGEESEVLSTGEAASRSVRRRDELRQLEVYIDGRPGLGSLSSRAGEALGSYVAPSSGSSGSAGSSRSASSSSSSSSDREMGALLRAPSAAQELVQTGRPSGRHGGGEVEIPTWFEAAARKMLEDRSAVSDGISLAELTLVQTAAPTAIAASSRGSGGSSQPMAPSTSNTAGAEKEKLDIEKLANEVYREILQMMDMARARNGEPYL